MDKPDPTAIYQNNIRKILLFLEEYDPLNASWENAEEFLNYLKTTIRISFRSINRQYLQHLYDRFLKLREIPEH